MTRPRSRTLFRRARAPWPAVLVALLVAGLMPAPTAAGGPTTGTAPATATPTAPANASSDATDATGEEAPGQHPSSAYEDWVTHEHDRISFTPGERVTVGFTPRAKDGWPVGGSAPVKLPPGRASGRQMAAGRNGTAWAHVPGVTLPRGAVRQRVPDAPVDAVDAAVDPVEAPVDAPSNSRPIDARRVSAVMPAPDEPFDLAAASGLRRQVYGFLPYWEVSGASTRLNYDVLSTIAYFSVGATANGNLKKRDPDGTLTTGWGGWTSSSMTKVINAAHRKGTRVVLSVSVFAWTGSQANVQRALLGSSAARLNFARQVVAAVRDRGADGVNLDFEPLARGYADDFVKLLKTIRSEFNRIRRGYSVVYDTTAFIGNYPLEASVGRSAADAIFVMGYDYRIGSSSTSGSIAPLSGPTYDLADTVRAYRARVPAGRLILGIPWYGRAWSTSSSGPRAKNVSGLRNGYSTAVNYENVLDYAAKYGRRWDPVEQSPYVVYRRQNCTSTYGCVTSWRQIWYDDAASMKRRYQLVNDYGLRGAGMWALGYEGGHGELYRAVSESFLVDKAPPTSGIRNLAPSQGDEGFVVSWAGKDASPIGGYDVQVSVNGGAWTAWQTRTKATSDVFLGRDGRTYAFRVRATDSKGLTGPWNVLSRWSASPSLRVGEFGRVTLDGLAYRAGPDTSSARLGSIRAGTIVAITRGPVKADGYTWYEVTQPIREWSPVSFAERGVWIATSKGTTRYVRPAHAPNTTSVKAGVRGLDFGGGGTTGVGTGSAQVAARAFSPNGDRSEDGLRLRWTNAMAMDAVRVDVRRVDGSLIGSRRVAARSAGAQAWTWDGTVNGKRLKDGQYLLQVVATRGGTTFHAPSARPATKPQVAAYAVRIDTQRPVITSAAATNQVISPNGDGVRDSTRLSLAASGGAVRWSAVVTDASGRTVRTRTGTGSSVTFTWAGTNDAGTRVRDGRYVVALTLFDNAGNGARRTGTVTVDTTGPTISPAVSAPAFSPNGDGLVDTSVLSFTANEPATGTAKLYKGTSLVRSWKVANTTSWSTTWDGRRTDGRMASEGVYTLRIHVRDAVGNVRDAAARVVVDQTLKTMAWAGDFFPQDGDTLKATSLLSFGLRRDATVSLRIRDAAGTLVRTVWNGRGLDVGTRGYRWDGRSDRGSVVPQGRYLATLRVKGRYGIVEYARWVWAAGFTLTPDRTRVRPGQSLTVRFRSVEPLSTTPRVTFTQPGRSGVTVTATKAADGSWRATFAVRSGGAGSASVRVAATDRDGQANSTRILVRVAS